MNETKKLDNESIATGKYAADKKSALAEDRFGLGKIISNQTQNDASEPFKDTEIEKPMKFLDKITKRLSDTSDKWAGKNPGGEKK